MDRWCMAWRILAESAVSNRRWRGKHINVVQAIDWWWGFTSTRFAMGSFENNVGVGVNSADMVC
jgi:hypothetical protein